MFWGKKMSEAYGEGFPGGCYAHPWKEKKMVTFPFEPFLYTPRKKCTAVRVRNITI